MDVQPGEHTQKYKRSLRTDRYTTQKPDLKELFTLCKHIFTVKKGAKMDAN
jgi:hypothetical protein